MTIHVAGRWKTELAMISSLLRFSLEVHSWQRFYTTGNRNMVCSARSLAFSTPDSAPLASIITNYIIIYHIQLQE